MSTCHKPAHRLVARRTVPNLRRDARSDEHRLEILTAFRQVEQHHRLVSQVGKIDGLGVGERMIAGPVPRRAGATPSTSAVTPAPNPRS